MSNGTVYVSWHDNSFLKVFQE